VATKAKRTLPPVQPQRRRHGLGAILLTIALSTGICAALGVIAAHLLH
jgi:hypothetical protein